MHLDLHHPLGHNRIILDIPKGFRLARSLEHYHGKQIALLCTRTPHKYPPLMVQPLEMYRMFDDKRLLIQWCIGQPGRTGSEKNEKVHRLSSWKQGSLARRIEQKDFRWFEFPLPRRHLFHQNGPGSFPGILRFPEGEANERSFLGVL